MASQRQAVSERSQELLQTASSLAWALYVNLLEPVVHAVVPQPTRKNFQQLIKETNNSKIVKNREFFVRHFQALRPATAQGWLALLAVVLFSYVGIASLAVCLLGFSAMAVFCLGLFLASVGVSVSIILGLVATFLFGSTFIMAGAAGGAVIGYLTLSVSRASMHVVLEAVERVTGITLHDNRSQRSPTTSHLDVISEGEEEGQDSDSDPGAQSGCLAQTVPNGHNATTNSQPMASSSHTVDGSSHQPQQQPQQQPHQEPHQHQNGSSPPTSGYSSINSSGADPESHFSNRRHLHDASSPSTTQQVSEALRSIDHDQPPAGRSPGRSAPQPGGSSSHFESRHAAEAAKWPGR